MFFQALLNFSFNLSLYFMDVTLFLSENVKIILLIHRIVNKIWMKWKYVEQVQKYLPTAHFTFWKTIMTIQFHPPPPPPRKTNKVAPLYLSDTFILFFLFSDIWGYNNYVTVKGISVCFGDSVGKPNTTKNCGIYQKITHFD